MLNKLEEIAKQKKPHENLCGIAFDVNHLSASLSYNQITDSIEEREELGEFGKSYKTANYAIVFIVKGLISK